MRLQDAHVLESLFWVELLEQSYEPLQRNIALSLASCLQEALFSKGKVTLNILINTHVGKAALYLHSWVTWPAEECVICALSSVLFGRWRENALLHPTTCTPFRLHAWHQAIQSVDCNSCKI